MNKAVIPLSHVVDVIAEHDTTIAFAVRGAYSLTRSWSSTYPQMSLQQEMNESFQMVFIDPVRTMDQIRQTIDKIRVAQLHLVEKRHNKQQADDEDIRYKAEMNRAEAKYRSDLEMYKIAAQNRRSAHNAELAQYNWYSYWYISHYRSHKLNLFPYSALCTELYIYTNKIVPLLP